MRLNNNEVYDEALQLELRGSTLKSSRSNVTDGPLSGHAPSLMSSETLPSRS